MITGYSKSDILATIIRIDRETQENRTRALKLYDHMETAMLAGKGDLVVLSQMADRYLEQASRATDLLVRLATTMQKLLQTEDDSLKNKNQSAADRAKIIPDLSELLTQLDLTGVSPFLKREKEKTVVVAKKDNDVHLEADL